MAENWFEFIARKLAEDIDGDLLARSLALTPAQRIAKLMEMQQFADLARKARESAANGPPEKAG